MKQVLIIIFLLSTFGLNAQIVDSFAIKQVDSMIIICKDLGNKGDFDRALEMIDSAEILAIENHGEQSAIYARVCAYRGIIHNLKNDFPQAEDWFLKALSIRENVLGKEHVDYVSSLNNLGRLYYAMGDSRRALPYYLQVKEIKEVLVGKNHPEYAESLNTLSIIYLNMGDYKKAKPLLLEARSINEKIYGKYHLAYARNLENLGSLCYLSGDLEEAEPFYLEVKTIREKMMGKEHPSYALILNNIGNLYSDMGNNEKSVPYYIEAISIHEKFAGKENAQYLASLNNLGAVYDDMGNYEKAENCFLEVMAIRKKMLGETHPEYALSMSNLASLYMDLGNYDQAESYLLESLSIKEKVFGKEHLEYAKNLIGLGIVYAHRKNYVKAEAFYLESKTIFEQFLGSESAEYALNLNNLGLLYKSMGNYEQAERYLFQAKLTREAVSGKEHLLYLSSVLNLGSLFRDMGDYEKAEVYLLDAKESMENVLGRQHPKYERSLFDLMALYALQNEYAESERIGKELLDLAQKRLEQSVSFLSEQELAKYAMTFQANGDRLSSYIWERIISGTDFGILPELNFNHILFLKGFLLSSASRMNTLASSKPEALILNDLLKSYRVRLSRELSLQLKNQKSIADLEEKANITEKKIAQLVKAYDIEKQQVDWQDVQLSLNEDEVAIEFISFSLNFPRATDSIMYAALLVRPGMTRPLFVPLFEERQLKDILSKKSEAQYSELLAQIYTRGLLPLNGVGSREGLYDLCWRPLDSLLTGIRTIYYSPAGLLHQINIDAIPAGLNENEEMKTLSDKYTLVRLGSTRSLVVKDSAQINTADEMVMVGGIQYELDTTLMVVDSLMDETRLATAALSFEYAYRSVPVRGDSWNYLPGSESEVVEISDIINRANLPVRVYRGSKATEEVIKQLGHEKSSPRVLHVATHGFFFPDPKVSIVSTEDLGEQAVFQLSDHPMIRSGLLLSGSNYAWLTGKPWKEDMEDGILTAYEISQMNLSNTELVVLSACETGLGDIQGNEGVYGLQRAFKIAGAKYLIMSLWQVPDKQTSFLMTTFYKRWLEDKMTIPKAFHRAQKELRDSGLDPYQWAGFVLIE